MKKFRLFTTLALLASITTVFAAWQLYIYPDAIVSNSVELGYSFSKNDIENLGEIEVEIKNDESPTVTFDNFAATVNNDIEIEVTAAQDDAINDYNFYYVLYGASINNNINSFNSDGEFGLEQITDETIKHSLEIVDGKATIAKAELGEKLTPTCFKDEYKSEDALVSDLTSFEIILHEKGLNILIYAEKTN